MNMREEVTFRRNTEGIMIPSGERVLIPNGSHGTITQSLGDQRVGAAERLCDRAMRSVGDQHAFAAGDHDAFSVAPECDLFAHVHSVVTTSCSPCRALCNVCHASVAHFTRAGNSDTPENAARRPNSASLRPAGSPITSL